MGDAREKILTLAMASVDGEATLAEQRSLREALARDPSVAADVDVFRRTGRSLGRMYDDIATAPVPEHLIRVVMETPMGPARSNVSAIPARAAQPNRTAQSGRSKWRDLLASWEMPALVFAASATAFVAGGFLMPGSAAMAPGAGNQGAAQVAALEWLRPSAALGEALTVANTGAERQLSTKSGTLSVRVVESFRDQAGTPCREFEAQGASGPRQYGVACHEGTGWQLKAVFEGPARTGSTTTAGPGELSELLDTAAGRIRSGDALPAAEERKLIDGGWAK